MNDKLSAGIKANILIADDVINNVKVLNASLNKRGYETIVAYDGIEALRLARESVPDLILLDIMMPGLDGYEVCEKLKEDDATKHIPVIFLTVRNEINDVLQGFELGAADYIYKPFNPMELAARVKTHLELKFARDKNAEYIEQLKEANRKLTETGRELEKLNIQKDRFFSIVAHDLRNPFQGLLGLSDVLTNNFDQFDKEETKELCLDINHSANTLYGLLENLLSWSRIQMGTLKIKEEKGDLRIMVNDSIAAFADNAREKNLRVANNVGIDHEILADINMINTVIRNMVSNAIKFTPRDGLVEINAREEGEFIILDITDTGVGMDSGDMEKLFDYKSHFSRPGTENEYGTGLGLILAKEFVEENGGKIEIKSEKGSGTTFSIYLPAAE
jgi:signal transduction histidine kinase